MRDHVSTLVAPITERSEVIRALHVDLIQLLGLRTGEVTSHTRLVAAHFALLRDYVRLLEPSRTSMLMIGRVDVEPGPHSYVSKHRETRIDRWLTKAGPLGPFRPLAWPFLVPVGWALNHAAERETDRFVVALGPLVRVFLGAHMRRTALRIAKGYALLGLELDPAAADSPLRRAWLSGAKSDLELLASYLPTWRSLANALLAIPLISLLPTILFGALGTKDVQGTVAVFGPTFLAAWPLWLPTMLYFLTVVSWSYAVRRHLLLGRATLSEDETESGFYRTIYSLEERVVAHLPVSRPRELALDLLFPAATYLFIAGTTASVWLGGEPNARGEPPPISLLFTAIFLASLSGGYLIAMARRKVR